MYINSPCTSKVSKSIFLWGKTSPTKNNIWLLAAALLAAWHGVDKSQTQTYTLSAPKKRIINWTLLHRWCGYIDFARYASDGILLYFFDYFCYNCCRWIVEFLDYFTNMSFAVKTSMIFPFLHRTSLLYHVDVILILRVHRNS